MQQICQSLLRNYKMICLRKQRKQNSDSMKSSLNSTTSPLSIPQTHSLNPQNICPLNQGYSQKSLFSKLPLFEKQQNPLPLIKKQSLGTQTLQPLKKLDSLRQDILHCLSALSIEQNRNIAFKSLIATLQLEIRESECRVKNVREVEEEERLKQIAKVEYDVKQILQKHNQEIAKINSLKQHSASARSERVVFSNLFRKIEIEIKQHQQTYLQSLLRTETLRERKIREGASNSQKQPESNETHQKAQMPHCVDSAKFFVTNLPDTLKKKSETVKKSLWRNQQRLSKHSQQTNQKQLSIDDIQLKVQKIIVKVQSSNCAQTLQFYSNIQKENQNLSDLIQVEQKKIREIEKQIMRMRKEQRISKFCESRQISNLESLASNRKIRCIKPAITNDSEEEEDQNLEILIAILDQLEIPHGSSLHEITSNEQTLTALQHRIDCLFPPISYKRDCSISSGLGLDSIFSKMQRYGSCRQILTRKQLCSEYAKEVGRGKRVARLRP